MTLLEVVAGLGLLASLLGALLLARVRYARQAAAADRRMQAVAAADRLLAAWHQDSRNLPRDGGGTVPGDGQLAWRTRTVTNPGIEALGGRVVRLEITDERITAAPPLASVEFVVDPENPTRPGASAGPSPAAGKAKPSPAAGGEKKRIRKPSAPSGR